MKSTSSNMTSGPIFSQLIRFTIPLILGNLFQLTYNAADSMIVGKYIGDSALAAVGTAGPIMNMAILFVSGMCMGAGILMSTQYGAKEYDKLQRQISTTCLGGMVFSFLLTLSMYLIATPVLSLVHVPKALLPEASAYLKIIFTGFLFTFLYNFLSNTLRALGDSQSSLYFLIISSVFNILGDFFFVVILHLGVNGSALATVLSQILCCICCLIYIRKKIPFLCLGRKWFCFDRSLLIRTVTFGITSALQLMCVQLGKIFVQAIVNTQGISFMAAFTAINRVDDFAMTPQQNIAHGATTFMAQNRGARQFHRMKQGFRCAVVIQFCYTLAVSLLVFFLPDQIMRFFVGENSREVLTLGVSYMKFIAFLYFMSAATNMIQGFFRGIGNLSITLISTLTNMGVRVIAAWIFIRIFHFDFESLAFANFCGWIAMLLLEVPLMRKYNYPSESAD